MRFPVLAADANADLAVLLDGAMQVHFPPGEVIFDWGSPCPGFVLLLEGEIQVQLTAESGRQVTLYRVRPGHACLLTTSCLLSDQRYPASGIARSDVTLLVLESQAFHQALGHSTAFRRFVFEGFGQRLVEVIHRMEEVAFGSIDRRLARALLGARSDRATIDLTHEALGQELGTAREVVSRHLKRFEARDWVRLGRGRIEIVDPHALGAMGGESIDEGDDGNCPDERRATHRRRT